MVRSRIAQDKHEAAIERCKRMTPEERLAAFVAHSELMIQLYQAGANYRSGRSPASNKKHPKQR